MTDIKAQIDVLPGLDPTAPLLQVNDLHVEFRTANGVARAVNGANFSLQPGRPWPSSASPAAASP